MCHLLSGWPSDSTTSVCSSNATQASNVWSVVMILSFRVPKRLSVGKEMPFVSIFCEEHGMLDLFGLLVFCLAQWGHI